MSTDIEITPRIEQIIWKGMGVRSARQIAEETGLKPEQVLAIKRDLLSAVDELTIIEKRTKILITLEQLAQDAIERAEKADDEFAAGMLNAARGALKDSLAELGRLSKQDTERVQQLNTLRRKEIVRLYTSVVDAGVTEIAERYGIPEDELFAVFNRHLQSEAVKALES